MVMALLAWTGGMLFSTPPSSEETSKTDLLAMLAGFRSLCDHDQLIQGLHVGYDAAQNENLFNNSLFKGQESLLFEVAVAHLEYIDKIKNPAQAKQCASKSAILWKKYIEWYHALGPEQLLTLLSGHNRINKAVAHLGNALIRKGDIDSLFDEYSNIAALDILYFGTDAILIWKNGLYGCPDGNVNKQHTSITRRESISNGCEEQWNSYALTLKDWVDVAPLQLSAKNSYLREIEQIEEEIKKNRGEL
jgi:hypothetical protein